jgi:hypothetical protein
LYARSPSILTAEKRGGVLHDIADKLGELGFDFVVCRALVAGSHLALGIVGVGF